MMTFPLSPPPPHPFPRESFVTKSYPYPPGCTDGHAGADAAAFAAGELLGVLAEQLEVQAGDVARSLVGAFAAIDGRLLQTVNPHSPTLPPLPASLLHGSQSPVPLSDPFPNIPDAVGRRSCWLTSQLCGCVSV